MSYRNYATIERAGVRKKKFRARIFGGNGETLFVSQTYADKRNAILSCNLIGIQDIRDNT